MEVYVGVDWSAREVVCSSAQGDEPPRRITGAKRTFADVQEFIERVGLRHPNAEEVHVIIEAGASGWAEMFHHAGAITHVVDPKQAKAFGESVCSSGAKDDGRDSATLVEMGRSPRHRPAVWSPDIELRAQLCELAAVHEMLTKNIVTAQQRLRSHLRERFPELEAVLKDLTLRWVHRLLRTVPTPRHAQEMTKAALRALMARSGVHTKTLDRIWVVLQEDTAPWLTEGLAEAQATHVNALVGQIEVLGLQLAAVDQQLDELTADLDLRKNLETVGGIGTKMANRLLRFAFDFERAPEHRDAVGIQLGACPVFRGSGKTRSGKLKGNVVMRRTANHRARATTYLLGRLASQRNPRLLPSRARIPMV